MTRCPRAPGRAIAASGLLLIGALCVGCAHRAPMDRGLGAGAVGVYRARIEQAGGESHRFRLHLFAELPDRLHGEVVSPLGAVLADLDGGAGRMAVSLPRDRAAFVGPASPDSLERILGVRATLGDLVAALLSDQLPSIEGYAVRRSPTAEGVLPRRLEIAASGRSLTLDLKRRLPLETDDPRLGTGSPLAGMTLHPLDELVLFEFPGLEQQAPEQGG